MFGHNVIVGSRCRPLLRSPVSKVCWYFSEVFACEGGFARRCASRLRIRRQSHCAFEQGVDMYAPDRDDRYVHILQAAFGSKHVRASLPRAAIFSTTPGRNQDWGYRGCGCGGWNVHSAGMLLRFALRLASYTDRYRWMWCHE